jgi:GntR family transcriptional regulator/MocR family aminotransferase
MLHSNQLIRDYQGVAMEHRLISELLRQHLARHPQNVKQRVKIYLALRSAILEGRIPPGTKLPPTRVLADDVGIGRNTIVRAYEQLTVEGYMEGRVGDGSYVSEALARRARAEAPKRMLGLRREGLSRRGGLIAANASSSIAQGGAFAPGVPDVELFPFATWRRLVSKYLDVRHAHLLQYAHTGYGPLKTTLASYLRVTRMMTVDPRQVLIVNGSHQAMDLCARMLTDPGDRAWVEDPGYWGARNVLQAAALQVTPIPLDEKGMAPTARDWSRPPRLIFVSPSSQYPTGMVLSLDRRLHLLEQADRAGSWIVEDDYDNELHYSGHPLASLFGLADRQRVLYMGTFSKVMFPGIRLAYVVVPEDLVDAFVIGNAELYRGGRLAEQAALAEFIEEGHFSAHIKRMRGVYSERREVLLREMSSLLGDLVTPSEGRAGLQVVYRFNQPVDDTMVVAQSLAAGVVCRPLSMYYLDQRRCQPGLNLGFAAVSADRIRPAARTLARIIEKEHRQLKS